MQEEREKAYLQDNHHFYIKSSTRNGVAKNLHKLLEATKKESLQWVSVITNIIYTPGTLADIVGYEWINNGMTSLSLTSALYMT